MLKKKKITDIKKPKKRMRSLWVVLLTSLATTLIVGGGFAGFLYWQENFAKKDNTKVANSAEEKIEGKNVVVATGNNGNLFVSFYNIQDNKTVTKKIATEITVQGGKWEKDNKNEVVQFSEDGQNFVTLEVKESSLSDKEEFARFVKYSNDGKEKDLIIEDKNSLSFGNFVYSNSKIYYIYTNYKNDEIESRDLYVLDVGDKNPQLLVKNVGDFLEKELTLKDNKIYSSYILKGIVYESVIDIQAKTLTKANLFKAVKTKDFELTVRDVYPSPDFSKYIYKDYTQKDGYQIKIYDKATKKTSVLKKDKENVSEEIFWKNDGEIVYKKKPVFSTNSGAKEAVILLNISDIASEKVLVESELGINIASVSPDGLIFAEDKKMYFFGEERKDLNLTGFFGIQDTLFSAILNF